MKEIIDLDKELGLPATEDEIPIKEIVLGGRTWHILCDVNSFSIAKLGGGDTAGLSEFIGGLVIEEEREDFVAMLAGLRGLDPEAFNKLLSRLMEVAAERPTERPSSSSPSAKSRASVRRSTAASS